MDPLSATKETVTNGRLNVHQTLSAVEFIPPAAVGNLAVSASGMASLTLTWKATGDDGTAIKYAVHAVFVPYSAIRYIHLLRERDSSEQEAKKKELEERFRRQTLEALSAHTKEAELLAQTDRD